MKSIKLRAWDGKKLYRDCFEWGGKQPNGLSLRSWIHEFHEDWMYGGNILLEHWIGLHDKNGTEIYEGDIIVGFFAWGAVSGVVEYDEKIAAFCTKYPDDMTFDGIDLENFFVAGNIHENPELLEEQP